MLIRSVVSPSIARLGRAVNRSQFVTPSRFFCVNNEKENERERLDYDVVIVGVGIRMECDVQGGCAGLSAAIRLKTESAKQQKDLSVCVLEKGEAIGSHVMSGCLLNTDSLSTLLPDWKQQVCVELSSHEPGQSHQTESEGGEHAVSSRPREQLFHPIVAHSALYSPQRQLRRQVKSSLRTERIV